MHSKVKVILRLYRELLPTIPIMVTIKLSIEWLAFKDLWRETFQSAKTKNNTLEWLQSNTQAVANAALSNQQLNFPQ